MKVRNGFISNSSSSSFIVLKNRISNEQCELIVHPYDKAAELGMANQDCIKQWTLIDVHDIIKGETSIDNFDYIEFLEKIGLVRGMHFEIIL